VSAGRRTEIDYITGYLLQVARNHAIVARHNTDLFERVKNIAD
jgi:ketopantoate reductase